MKSSMRSRHAGTVVFLSTLLIPTAGFAMYPQHRYYRVNPGHFYVAHPELWRQGRWFHGAYDGAVGWWWMVGTTWYFYERPEYPYPNMTVAPVYYAEVPVAAAPQYQVVQAPQYQVMQAPPQTQIMQAPPQPQVVQAAPAAAPAQYYYCANPAGYYPYVRECVGGWSLVPATPSR